MNVDFTSEEQVVVQQAIERGRIENAEQAAREAFSLWVELQRAETQRNPATPSANEIIASILRAREGNLLPDGVTIRDLIEAGRA